MEGLHRLVSHGEATDSTVDPDAVPAPAKQTFLVLTIRHPRWTKAHPHEDLPIMIFTRTQWKRVSNENDDVSLIVSAAPIPPSELGRNIRYVFALPARYNYDYRLGWRELERLIETHPLHGF